MAERHFIAKDLEVKADVEAWLKDAEEDIHSGCERRLEVEAKMDELDASE